ncbi:peptidoglycan-binding protein [bacterium]|nr:MAG: peptidoglycan-binding protein [bacterium]
MKKIAGVIIIILFLIPLLSHSLRYFKEIMSQKKIVSEKKRSVRGASKVSAVQALFKNSKKASALKEIMKSTSKSSNVKSSDMVKKNTGEVRPKEQKGEPNIHDEILSYRLNSKDHIKQIQTALKKAGFYKGEIDGKMGPRTRRAIKEFQKTKKLNPDGVVGSKTREVLERYLKN